MRKIIVLLVTAIAAVTLLCGCESNRMYQYYSDVDNYIDTTADVVGMYYYKEADKLVFVLDLDGIDYADSHLVLRGENAKTAVDQGALETISIGSQITFTAAPRYFGEGYEVPIVALSCNSKELLPFENGYNNLISEFKAESVSTGVDQAENIDNNQEDAFTSCNPNDSDNQFRDMWVVISGVEYDERINTLFFSFDSDEYDRRIADYIPSISGENLKIVLNNGIFEKVKIGMQVHVTIAPMSMKTDVFIPVTSISCDDEIILDSKVGSSNLEAEFQNAGSIQ